MSRSKSLASRVPELRVRVAREAEVAEGDWVVYWMIAARRPGWNFGLERAAEWSRALGKPLVVLEPLRVAYPWASARLHRFVLDGMAEHARVFAERGVLYRPYVEPAPGAGRGLLEAMASRAALVVTDEFPCFFLPRMVAAAAEKLAVRLEVVDSNGLVPLRATPGPFSTAFAFRRWLQAHLGACLRAVPSEDPLRDAVDPGCAKGTLARLLDARWPVPPPELLAGDPRALAELPVDARVAPVETRGGASEAGRALERFVATRLEGYAERRNHPDREGTSGLSPYLHFGHLSAHQAFAAVAAASGASAGPPRRTDGRKGWFGADEAGEEFLDQLVTWRELGYVFAWHRPDHDRYESLPEWARQTMEAHARPQGPHLGLEEMERAESADPVWNAAQTQLLRTGTMHNYLRMLWGKKILEWSPSPREALARLIHLNNKYALDGRDPNSYSGIAWCLGRFDRPWGPKRPVFGTVRYMSSDSTRRKLDLGGYLARFGPETARQEELFGAPPSGSPPRRSRQRLRGKG